MSLKCRSLYMDRGISESSNYYDLDKLNKQNKSHKTSFHVLAACKGRILLEFSIQQSSLQVQISQAQFPKTNLRDTLEPSLKINFTSSNVEKHVVPYVKMVSTAADVTLRYDSCCVFHNLNMNQRIIISSYVRNENDQIEILGTMSFGIRKLWDSDMLSGWYYLLKENIGKKKHLKVYQETIPRSVTANALCGAEPNATPELFNFQLIRKNDEFGFTICGNQPAYVGKVENDSSAYESGLQPGDAIVKISHLLVFSCSAKAIAQILRLYPISVNITIIRSKKSSIETNNDKTEKLDTKTVKTKTNSKSISWFKKIIHPKRNSSSHDISLNNCYISNLRSKIKDDSIAVEDIPTNQNNGNLQHELTSVTDRLQYLGHIQSVKFPKNNNSVEFECIAWLIEPGNYSCVTILLFTQLILITQKEPDGFYTVVKSPIQIDSISYLSILTASKYDIVLQHVNSLGVKEFIHLQCECSEELVNLIRDKRKQLETETITIK